ncbi:hypothetical protein BATDEDRAFT_21526 [Batrachochytrium dendrobatidis JAM81]|uniref:Uncharacterized protein n=2 Tax=Batrachochytrium dendrobatidis TaxID=109871 RepID=F4NTP9_BATDJ|nr:uncharacterized protein BATDEDRAFT_21526 [Batrachochytrium dendrobatidis JAM81]EGF83934.1 hypothetical protein BATDEDRAFT_21526 [Batrachochytrium dendrobatidis JAM81]KAJ8331313.1 hypothetical protein O5D80_000246 [Batrachochytrium dendrobatidis]KAK5671764.1 hypothetical protein QVD99_001599 [Batrachochytrium dendrobatidis]|eukprot:XP_006675311.1 hypothetical protein BATDEDRAFT_21526 [Batrachochytrium dendrobatidis JAM81]
MAVNAAVTNNASSSTQEDMPDYSGRPISSKPTSVTSMYDYPIQHQDSTSILSMSASADSNQHALLPLSRNLSSQAESLNAIPLQNSINNSVNRSTLHSSSWEISSSQLNASAPTNPDSTPAIHGLLLPYLTWILNASHGVFSSLPFTTNQSSNHTRNEEMLDGISTEQTPLLAGDSILSLIDDRYPDDPPPYYNSDAESNTDELPTYSQVQATSSSQANDSDEDWLDQCSNCMMPVFFFLLLIGAAFLTVLPLTWEDPPMHTPTLPKQPIPTLSSLDFPPIRPTTIKVAPSETQLSHLTDIPLTSQASISKYDSQAKKLQRQMALSPALGGQVETADIRSAARQIASRNSSGKKT